MNKKNIKIGIIGLGYVGLPLAVEFGKIYDTVGFDLNKDRINILQATLLGMYRSITEIKPLPDYAIVDGNHYPNTKIKGKAIIKGDCLSKSIAAASILAKVTRDRIMIDYAKLFPDWSFDKHKGYPTDLHRELISKYGLTPFHRKSFKIKPFQMNFL